MGSASATGSVGGRTTTWASGSARGEDAETDRDADEMSVDCGYRDIDERDRYSAAGDAMDQDGDGSGDDASLVGFGEGASSTVSGPTYSGRGVASPFGRGPQGGEGPVHVRGGSVGGVETAERILRERLDDGEGRKGPALGSPDESGLGKFYFEGGK